MFKIGICAEMKNEADPTKQKWSFGTIFKVLGSIVVVFGTIYAATIWVQATARAAVLDEAFLATLSTRGRPICIFDSNGSIELDLGAGEYIDAKNIQVTPLPDIYGFSIKIPAKRVLTYPPLVSGLDVS